MDLPGMTREELVAEITRLTRENAELKQQAARTSDLSWEVDYRRFDAYQEHCRSTW